MYVCWFTTGLGYCYDLLLIHSSYFSVRILIIQTIPLMSLVQGKSVTPNVYQRPILVLEENIGSVVFVNIIIIIFFFVLFGCI